MLVLEGLALLLLVLLITTLRFFIRYRGGYSVWDVLREQYSSHTSLMILIAVAAIGTGVWVFLWVK